MVRVEFSEFEIERDIEAITKEIVGDIAQTVPDEMRGLMPTGGVSTKGNPPYRQSGDLARSLEALANGHILTIETANHGGYLDPLFSGFKGAGYLNRPFIELGIDRALAKSL